MHNVFNPVVTRTKCVSERKRVKLPRLVEKVKSFFNDGLLQSVVVHEEEKPQNRNLTYLDFSLQSIIQAQAFDLLRPVGSIAVGTLEAAETLETVGVSIHDFAEKYKDLQTSSSTVETSVETSVESKTE